MTPSSATLSYYSSSPTLPSHSPSQLYRLPYAHTIRLRSIIECYHAIVRVSHLAQRFVIFSQCIGDGRHVIGRWILLIPSQFSRWSKRPVLLFYRSGSAASDRSL